jgi:chemotaxis protein methyltransferase CheR
MIDFTNIKRLTEDEFYKFAKLIYDESGIFLKESKITLLSNRLRKRLRALNLSEFSDYFNYINALKDKSKEIEELLDVVSTNETYFFRNERQFDALKDHCIPKIVKMKNEKKLKIWSAGCSTGEEPYTIAICVLESRLLLSDWNVSILATDIAPSVLEFARIGKYTGRRIEKVPLEILKKYFTQMPDNPEVYEVKDELKKLVAFSYLNLFKNSYPENVDIIFCRNVMIYFDRSRQKELIANFYNILNPWGYLFIGHSETLHALSDDFQYVKIMDSPVYVPKEKV